MWLEREACFVRANFDFGCYPYIPGRRYTAIDNSVRSKIGIEGWSQTPSSYTGKKSKLTVPSHQPFWPP